MNAQAPTLMLVEDERLVAFDLKNQLQAFGYCVGAVVASAEQAIAEAERSTPDLVLMDIHLEGAKDGIDAAIAIRARHSIPVVFLTAYADDDTLRRALESRPFGYLIKPCEARELHATIQMALVRSADEEKLRQSSVVFHTAAEGIVIADTKRRIVAVNAAFCRITGFDGDDVRGLDPDLLLRSERDADEFFPQLAASKDGYWQGKVLCHRKNGEPFPTWQSTSVVRAGAIVTHYVTAFSDITSIHLAEHKLDYLAHHDPLTDLPNRLLFDDRFAHAIDRARRQSTPCLLLFIDLDGFKLVNDTLGHAVGDELLRMVGVRLKAVMRSGDTVARLGGDEFVVLVDAATGIDAGHLAQKLLDTLRTPTRLAGEEITVSGSIGIAVFPEHGSNAQLLMRAADIAMYAAKADGRNRYRFYSADLGEVANERLHMEQGLRRAVESDALLVHYQPQIALADGRVVGVEALVRWPHLELGLILPERFIPIAEESDVIEALGRWVMRRACNDIRGRVDAAGRQLRLAVNVSARQFLSGGFVASVRAVLAETGFPAAALELEITESTLQVMDRSTDILNALKQLGVSISIDDFGTGYSSLSVLRDLPIDRIKIDRSFIVDLPQQADDRAIVEAVVALSRSLRLGITVEGIERTEQSELLERLGCGEGQGFLFSRPLPFLDLARLLDDSAGYLR